MHRFVLALTAALVATLALGQSVAAAPPLREELPPFADSAVLPNVCPFPVTVSTNLTGSSTTFFDRNGNVARIEIDTLERDMFTANGKTLVGLPYTFKVTLVFEPSTGELLHAYARGLQSRVQLPDGSVFKTAGRIDFVDHPDEVFVLQPDHGSQGNIEGFCAALAP
jgi:hypothetical protein